MRRELERPLAGAYCPVEVFLRRVVVLKKKRTAVGYAAVRESLSGIELDRTLEHLHREFHRPATVLMKELTPAQIVLVCFDVRRRNLFDCFLFVIGENDAQCGDDIRGYLVLNGEYVFELAIVPLRPELRVVSRIDELRSYAKTLARLANASLEYRSNLQLSRNLTNVFVSSLE